MLTPKTRWSIGTPDSALVEELTKKLGIRPLLAALLAARGHTAEEAAFFLSGELTFHDPLLLKGMPEAVARIREAVAKKEKLLVYGDYDADGVSSTSLVLRLLRMLEADFTYRIPHRVQDGYGLHTHYIEEAHREGISLIITVDTGITAVEQAEAAKSLGIDLIVTDHHEPPERLPDALAVVNPKQPGCAYPFKGLAGVGVAFKLAQALLGRVPEELAEWAALGTVADLMPLTDENRSIVKLGLQRLRTKPPVGFAALLRVSGVEQHEVTSHTIGFGLAPRINAVGRLESADDAVRLLVTDDPVEADAIARRLDALNKERQRMVETAAAEAVETVEREGGAGDAIVVASERWNPGIIGIVASRLVETYYRPTVVLSIDPETGYCKGSARTIHGFHLYDALKACESMFGHFGGHESAAGLSMHRDDLEAFAAAFRSEAASRLTEEMKVPVTHIDAELEVADITLEAIHELDKLAPFGAAHPAPKFAVRRAFVQDASVIGKDKNHAKFRLSEGDRTLDAVGFGIGDTVRRIAPGSVLSLVGELSINEWNGRRTPQMIVKDVAVSHVQLFDWRDAATASIFKERWERTASADWRPAFLLGAHEEPPVALSAWWKTVPAYRLSDDGEQGAVPANALGRERPLSSATDLFFVNCPFPYARFHLILKRETSIGRLYALDFGEYGSGGAIVDRDIIKRAYVCIRELPEGAEEEWIRTVAGKAGIGIQSAKLAIRVCKELRFAEEGVRPGTLRAVVAPARRELTESRAFALEQEAAAERLAWKRMTAEALRERLLGQSTREGFEYGIRTTEAVG
ncbi:single-stranded-DNA-specific exonuclease RecJ [Paenibacillus sp.]|uniref:single-stranded-DNA-specific exonuclease RecJ n=1 Tax=Paenibacillus sp. TaxID=58172 RepID=UPI002D42097D|nr:single-stranded-DNA-specific exonuclease RecJ [Paenibacillus sp.]HZG87007.1 single-stranded-DNA-specific exonuclease RecJ [Paenibacillus sp.]